MITKLISNHINFSKNKAYNARAINNLEIEVTFSLAIPAWVKDHELVKEDNQSILYCQNVKKGIPNFLITKNNANDSWYPPVSNNKFFRVKRVYNVKDWLTSDYNFTSILTVEREKIFREVKANILLEKIGQLTKDWNDVVDGNYNPWKGNFNYGFAKSLTLRPIQDTPWGTDGATSVSVNF
jgi:hypothetical protein